MESQEAIFERDGFQCQICGRGAATGDSIKVFDVPASAGGGQITVCEKHYNLLKNGMWEILKWNPQDKEDGLVVINSESRPVPKDELWFYVVHEQREIMRGLNKISEILSTIKANEWGVAFYLSALKEAGAHKKLRYKSIAEMAASELGVLGAWAEKAAKVGSWVNSLGIAPVATSVPLSLAMRIYSVAKEMDKEDVVDLFAKASALPAGEARKMIREMKRGKKKSKYIVLRQGDLFIKEAEDDADVDGDVVIRGGKVVYGQDKIKEA